MSRAVTRDQLGCMWSGTLASPAYLYRSRTLHAPRQRARPHARRRVSARGARRAACAGGRARGPGRAPEAAHDGASSLELRLGRPLDALQDRVVQRLERARLPDELLEPEVRVRGDERVRDHVLDRLGLGVRVHDLVHVGARVEEVVQRVHLARLEAHAPVDHLAQLDQPRVVERRAHVARRAVAEQVVELVDVHRVPPVRHDLVEEHLAAERELRPLRVRARVLPRRVVVLLVDRDELLHGAQVVALQPVARVHADRVLHVVHVVQVLQHLARHGLVRPLAVRVDAAQLAQPRQHLVVKEVREGAVAEVVAEPGDGHELHLLVRHAQVGLTQLEVLRPPLGQVVGAERVLKARVRRGGVHVRGETELLELTEPLELWRVDYCDRVGRDPEQPVDRVVHQLAMLPRAARGWNHVLELRGGVVQLHVRAPVALVHDERIRMLIHLRLLREGQRLIVVALFRDSGQHGARSRVDARESGRPPGPVLELLVWGYYAR